MSWWNCGLETIGMVIRYCVCKSKKDRIWMCLGNDGGVIRHMGLLLKVCPGLKSATDVLVCCATVWLACRHAENFICTTSRKDSVLSGAMCPVLAICCRRFRGHDLKLYVKLHCCVAMIAIIQFEVVWECTYQVLCDCMFLPCHGRDRKWANFNFVVRNFLW